MRPFLTVPNQINLNHILLFTILFQHLKHQAISSIFSRGIADFKLLRSDWPRVFWLRSQEQDSLMGFYGIL